MTKKKRYLTKDLIVILLASTITLFLLGQIMMFYLNYQDSKRTLENNITTLIQGLSYAATDALWDYDYSQLENIGDAFMLHREMASVVIIDDIAGIVYEKENKQEFSKTFNIQHQIVKDDSSIGLLVVNYTDYYFYREIFLKLVIEGFIFITIIVAIIYVVTKFSGKITKPIQQLAEHVKTMKDPLETHLTIESESAEIDTLIQAYYEMRVEIREYTSRLKIANETLEAKVEERTNELNIRNQELNNTIELLKDAEIELMRASKLELTQQLVSGLAHEVNTPLGNAVTLSSYLPLNLKYLKNNVGLKLADTTEMKKVDETIIKIQDALSDVVALMSRFKTLDFRSGVSFEKIVNLKEVLVNSFNLLLREETCDLDIDLLCPEDLRIHTKPFVLMEVMKQLFENTCIHAYSDTEENRVRISCHEIGDEVKIYFEDFGKGMSIDTLEKAFTPFSKNDLHTAGTGIGLSIVENLVVNGLKGQIHCKSVPEQGTTFEITLTV